MRSAYCLLFLLLGAGTAFAQLQFRPMSVELTAEGRGSSATFTVSNSGKDPIAVRLRMLTREVAEDGTEERRAVDKSYFSLFPASVVLEGGQARAVRLSWRGSAQPDRELAFRILAEQVPVDFAETRGEGSTSQVNIEILLRYLGAVYVKSSEVTPNITSRVERTDEPSRAKIILENAGTGHAILQNLAVTITAAGSGEPTVYSVDQDQLKGISNANMLAGLRRVHPIILPPDFPDGPLSVNIDFETP